MMKRLAWLAAVLLAAIPTNVYAGPNLPTKPIEQKYYADGPWTVSTTVTATACDSKGDVCDIYFPTNLGANGFHHPIVVWANGSATSPVPALMPICCVTLPAGASSSSPRVTAPPAQARRSSTAPITSRRATPTPAACSSASST
jgi:hypothetical protein